jgi:hypothetical protein
MTSVVKTEIRSINSHDKLQSNVMENTMPADRDKVRTLLLETKAISEQIKSIAIYTQDFQVGFEAEEPVLDSEILGLMVEDAQSVAIRSLRVAEFLAIAISKSISDDIVDDLKDKVRKKGNDIKNRYNEKGIPLHEVARANDIDRRDLCLYLHEIKKNSGGKLPKNLEDDWRDMMCSTYKFT